MSQPFRAFRSMIALTVAAYGVHSVGYSQEAFNATEVAPVAYSLDSVTTPISQTGLIRYLQEDAAKGDQLVDTNADEAKSIVPSGKMQSPKGAIELAPLSIPNTNIQGIGTGVRPEDVTTNRLPTAQTLPTGETRNGGWGLQSKNWVPGGFCHQPLYLEDPMLERHGHVRFPHLQPVASGLRFFGSVSVLPYLATLRHPLDDVHTLGAYQPGTAAPALQYRAHYDPVALRNQFLATAGTAVAVP